ncbi:hypothetical protein NLO24_26280, partial [Escherichia coli]|nr:hypothetical protein [Escherichia coli]
MQIPVFINPDDGANLPAFPFSSGKYSGVQPCRFSRKNFQFCKQSLLLTCFPALRILYAPFNSEGGAY